MRTSVIDPLGDTTYRFDRNGLFMKKLDLDKKGSIVAIGAFEKDAKTKDNRWVIDREFSFNDLSIDKGQLDNLKPRDEAITFVHDENRAWIMRRSSVHEMSWWDRWNFARSESNSGRMDFKWNYTLRLKGLGGSGDGDVIQFDQREGCRGSRR